MGMDIIKERIDLFNKSYDGKINFTIIDKKDENGKPMGTRIVFDLLQKPYIDNEKTTSDKTWQVFKPGHVVKNQESGRKRICFLISAVSST